MAVPEYGVKVAGRQDRQKSCAAEVDRDKEAGEYGQRKRLVSSPISA
jgi:hypothetical protein